MTILLTTDERKALFLIAYKQHRANVSLACQSITIGRSTVYLWAEEDESFANEMRKIKLECMEDLLDEAEDVVKLHILAKDKQVAEWLLTKQGKARGYGSRVELEHTGDAFRDLSYPDDIPDPDDWEATQSTDTDISPKE